MDSLVPDLVVRLTIPPEARPYSAEKLLVTTLYSWTESIGVWLPMRRLKTATFSAPSNRISVPASRCPLMATPTPWFDTFWPLLLPLEDIPPECCPQN